MRIIGHGIVIAAVLAATSAFAQEPWFRGFGGRGEGVGVPPIFRTAQDFDGGFQICRLMYRSVRSHQRGLGWGTDYPYAEINLSIRLGEITRTRISRGAGDPKHFVVRPTDDELFQCPFVLMSDPGSAGLSDGDAQALRSYLLKGGMIWADDYWGPWAWDDFAREMAKVLPPSQYPTRELPFDHTLFRTMFTVTKIPQVPSWQYWAASGGDTSEMGAYSAQARMFGIADASGRLMVVMTHNTDVADAWEREGEDPQYFMSFSPDGYALGINVALYAMTH